MKTQEFEIAEILTEIAQNENENFKTFRERFVEYCITHEKAVIMLLRLLKGMESELSECLTGNCKVNVDRAIIIKVLKTIRIELEIIRYRMRRPGAFVHETVKVPQPAGEWTNDKIDLIELIYAIKMSVNHGRVSIKALQDCFEYIFQVQLGNIYDRFTEINDRKYEKASYLESLIKNLNKILDKLK